MEFSTTEKSTALCYLKKIYPKATEENAKEVLDLVGTKIRVGDPYMYGKCPIFPIGKQDNESIVSIFKKFKAEMGG